MRIRWSLCTMALFLLVSVFSPPVPLVKVEQQADIPRQEEDLLVAPEKTQVSLPTGTPVERVGGVLTLENISPSEDQEIQELFRNYYNACIAQNMTALASYVTDIGALEEETLRKHYQYIEGVEDIKCYVLKDVTKDGYVVYVKGKMSIPGIATGAPGLSVFHVKGNETDGSLFIDTGALTQAQEEYEEELKKTQAIQNLILQVDEELQQAAGEDAALQEFLNRLAP